MNKNIVGYTKHFCPNCMDFTNHEILPAGQKHINGSPLPKVCLKCRPKRIGDDLEE